MRTYLGEDAQTLISDQDFIAKWRRLVSNCPWSTFFQDPDFVQIWFEHYSNRYTPFVITDFDGAGELKNLLMLAVGRDSGVAVPPGAYQSEYQCWLSSAENDSEFLSAALQIVSETTGQDRITFKFIPPNLTARLGQWLDAIAYPIVVRNDVTPVISLTAEPPPWQSLQKKSNKSRLSRLRKLGPVTVEICHGADRDLASSSQQLMEAVAPMYDLRQGAMSNVSPFREDRAKLGFHVALLERSEHFQSIVLRVGDDIVAAVVGPRWNGIFGIAVFAYSPFMARHSPGKLLLLQGTKVLHDAGVSELDLTPGGAWKERFSNGSRQVCELTFHLTRLSFVPARATEQGLSAAKSLLGAVGLAPEDARALIATLRKATPARVLQRTRRALAPQGRREFRVYAYPAEEARRLTPPERQPRVNSMADFLCFAPAEPWQSRQAFLKSVLDRFEAGTLGYSFAEKGSLQHCGWRAPRQTESLFTDVGMRYSYPQNTSVLYDFYTHPHARDQELEQYALRQMLIDAAREPTTEWVYISVSANNGLSRQEIEKIGFEYVESVFT